VAASAMQLTDSPAWEMVGLLTMLNGLGTGIIMFCPARLKIPSLVLSKMTPKLNSAMQTVFDVVMGSSVIWWKLRNILSLPPIEITPGLSSTMQFVFGRVMALIVIWFKLRNTISWLLTWGTLALNTLMLIVFWMELVW
jgi:hypothetical protein